MKPLRRVLRLLSNRIPEQTRRFIKLHLLPSGLVPYVTAAPADLAPRKQGLSDRYSIVVSCYNVEPYIDEFFRSLLAQTVDLARLEIIAVDDGSTDGTAACIAAWAERLPIRYIFQPNQGLAAARNTGLAYATGTWVSFPDPDDFLAKSYLEKVDREVARAHALPLSMISCKMVMFREGKGEKEDTHPLRYRFTAPRTVLPASDLENHMQLSAAACWLRRELIEANGLRFDPRVFPSFEDGHFLNRLLLLNPRTEVAFIKGAVYFYRKRQSADSTLDRSHMMPAWYLDNLRNGHLDMLHRAKAATGEVPRFIQRTALYDILWRVHELVDHPERAGIFTEEQQGEFFKLLEELFALIDCATINTFNLAHCHEEHKVGLLDLGKRARRPVTSVYVRQYDAAKNLMQLSFFSSDPENQIVARVNERAVPLRYVSRRRARILGRTFFFEHFFWVALDRHDHLSILVDTKICGLMRLSTQLGNMATAAKLRQALAPSPTSMELLPPALRNIRKPTAGPDEASKFRGCWLLQDRHDKADDNAVHLYRYLLSIGKAENAFFVLAADSPDWKRLQAEGFKLVAFDSPEHQIALLVAKFLISSHADRLVFWQGAHGVPIHLTNHRFVFLQHGVTKDDVSRWMNAFSIHRFITATEAEHRSIADPDLGYRISVKETALTGLCRHDRLLAIETSNKSILIMPSWRRHLRNEPSSESEYFPRWRSLLRSPRLRRLAQEKALRIVFCPHPNMTPFLSAFDVPGHVEVRNILTEESVQPLFAEAALLITDYSSVAFDLAYLDKPTVYYQFDAAEIFTGIHVYQRGYFDYARDGFGPVCETEDDVLGNVQAVLSGHEPPQYAERRRSTFRYRDGRCCERVYRSILALDEPLDTGDDVIALKSYTGVPNAGDAASSVIVSHFVSAPVRIVGRPPQPGPNLLGAGSILHWSDQYSVVWGTGFQSANQRLRLTPDKVFAIRGPLSRQRLVEAGCPCPALYGDPGILISQVFPKRAGSGGRLGVIPHYVDREHPFLQAAKDHGAHIIDPGMPLPDYLSELAQCDCILSSSLHGIVFAHSYGIPAAWVRLSSDVTGGAFKFQDYYMSIGHSPADIPDLSGDDPIERAVRAAGTPREEIDREALRGALERAQQYIFDKRAHGLAGMAQGDPIGPATDAGQRKILVGVDNAERPKGAHALAQRRPQTNRRDTA